MLLKRNNLYLHNLIFYVWLICHFHCTVCQGRLLKAFFIPFRKKFPWKCRTTRDHVRILILGGHITARKTFFSQIFRCIWQLNTFISFLPILILVLPQKKLEPAFEYFRHNLGFPDFNSYFSLFLPFSMYTDFQKSLISIP